MDEKHKVRFGGQVVLPAILVVVTVIYLIEGLRTMRPFEEGTAGPSFFPIVIAVIMIVALASILWRDLRPAGQSEKTEPVALAEPIKVVVLTIGYIALFKPVGYFISTAMYVLALLYVFRFKAKNPFVTVLWAVLIAGACFVLFSEVFQIRLPKLGGVI